MEVTINKCILAIITTDKERVTASTMPVFFCQSLDEQEKLAFALGKILGAMVHDLENGVYIIVRH